MMRRETQEALDRLQRTLRERQAGALEEAARRYWAIRQMSETDRPPPPPPKRAA